MSYPLFVTHDGSTCVLNLPLPDDMGYLNDWDRHSAYNNKDKETFDDPPFKVCRDIKQNQPGDGRIIRKRCLYA